MDTPKKGVKFNTSEKGSVKPSTVKYLPPETKADNADNNYRVRPNRQEKMYQLMEQRQYEEDQDWLEKYEEKEKNNKLNSTYNKQVNPNLTKDTTRNPDSVKHVRNIFDGTRKGGKKRSSKRTKRNRKTKSKRKH